MKLLTHNMLECKIKGVTNGYPLKIEADKVEVREQDYDPEFLKRMFGRIQWAALVEGAKAMGIDDLPVQAGEEMLEDYDFLQKLHHALLEVHLEEGALLCPETGRRFPVKKGIPNLLLNEDEC